MTTINATKGEFVNLINGLFAVQEMKGKEFGLIVSKNITAIRKELKSVEDAGTPSEEFLKLAEQVNVLANENTDESKKKIEQLEKDNQKNKNSKTKGPLAFFLFYCYVIFWGYVFWMPPLNYVN